MSKNKVFISTSTFAEFSDEPLFLLEEAGYSHALNPFGRKMNPGEIQALASDCIGLVAGTEKLDAATILSLSQLKAISRCGVGMDNVDQEAARQAGIAVSNTPTGPTLPVAELTINLILSLLRKTVHMNTQLREGIWKKQMGSLLFEKNIGIIGFGRIGRKTAGLLKAFGCDVCYFDTYLDDNIEGYKKMEMDDLLNWADIISIHISTSERMLGQKELYMMKHGAWIVNTSRGGVVDEDALFDALQSEHLSGAALDVFEQEPYQGRLIELQQCLLTPHIGSYAKEARVQMEIDAVKNLLNALQVDGGK